MSSAVAISAQSAGSSSAVSADQVVHAELELYEPTKAPGGAKTGAKLGSVAFQFNPREVTMTKAAKWESKPAKNAEKAGAAEFMGAQPATLSLEMFLDATAKHDTSVAKGVDRLMSCCVPTESTTGSPKAMPDGGVQMGWVDQLPRLHHEGDSQIHTVRRRRYAAACHVHGRHRGDAGRQGRTEPDIPSRIRPAHPRPRRGRESGKPCASRVRRPELLARDRALQRNRRSDAHSLGYRHPPARCRRRP